MMLVASLGGKQSDRKGGELTIALTKLTKFLTIVDFIFISLNTKGYATAANQLDIEKKKRDHWVK